MSRTPARRHQECIAYTLRKREQRIQRNADLVRRQGRAYENPKEEVTYFGFWCGAVTGAVLGALIAGPAGLIIGGIAMGIFAHIVDD